MHTYCTRICIRVEKTVRWQRRRTTRFFTLLLFSSPVISEPVSPHYSTTTPSHTHTHTHNPDELAFRQVQYMPGKKYYYYFVRSIAVQRSFSSFRLRTARRSAIGVASATHRLRWAFVAR